MLRRTLALALPIVLALAASAAHAQAPDWKKIRIGVEGAYPPFSEVGPDGKLKGFDIDIALALCAEMKAECTLVQQEWDGIIPALQSRKVDATISDDIKTNAVTSFTIALALIFLYIAVRFRDWRYGMAGLLSLLHDALVVLGLYSLLYKVMPFSLEIDEAFIASFYALDLRTFSTLFIRSCGLNGLAM